MVEGLSDLEFELIHCSQQKFDRLYGDLIDNFEESPLFRREDFEKEWQRIERALEQGLSNYWIKDSFGMGDYALVPEHDFTFCRTGSVHTERVICKEFIQIIIRITQASAHASQWFYHFTCESDILDGEFFIKDKIVYCAGDKKIVSNLTRDKIKPESLHRCVELNNFEWVRQMYKPGLFYRPAYRDSQGSMPQHYIKSVEIADFLIERGFDLNVRNSDGHTVLDKILSKEPWRYNKSDFRSKLVKYLVSRGAKTSFEIDHPLHYYCLMGTVSQVKEVLKYCNLYEFDSYLNEPPIMFALRSGVYSKVKLLLDCGADIDQKAADGDGVLATAFNCSVDIKLIKLLIDSGADINASCPMENNSSILHLFCRKSAELVQLLIDSGADVNSRDADGRTAAFHVEGPDALKILELLHNNGLSLAETDYEGNTCMEYFTQWAESFAFDCKLSSKYMNFAIKAQDLISGS